MFSGIVEGKARIVSWSNDLAISYLTIEAPLDVSDVNLGDSISVSGVCLTVVKNEKYNLSFELAPETIRKSKFGKVKLGDELNFERSLKLGDRIHGHIVSGHIDSTGTIQSVSKDGETVCIKISFPSSLKGYFAPKGSVTIDGVSLTVGEVSADEFSIYVIPHTLQVTTLGSLKVGDLVNIEVDMLARYVKSLLGKDS